MFHPTTHKVNLKVFQASCYSHHLSQYTLRETNLLFRVSKCNPYLESLLNYIMRHHHKLPLTGVMELRPDHVAPPRNQRGITSWPMRHHHEISPRDSWNYALTDEAPPWNYRGITFWLHQHHVPSTNLNHRSYQFHVTFITNPPTHVTCQDHAKLIIPAHTIRSYMHIHILHTLNRVIQTKLTINQLKAWKRTVMEQILVPISLKPGTLAQAEEVFHSSYRSSLRRDCQ